MPLADYVTSIGLLLSRGAVSSTMTAHPHPNARCEDEGRCWVSGPGPRSGDLHISAVIIPLFIAWFFHAWLPLSSLPAPGSPPPSPPLTPTP